MKKKNQMFWTAIKNRGKFGVYHIFLNPYLRLKQ